MLSLDHMGNLIEADSNRSDGKGARGPTPFGCHTALTLGDAHADFNEKLALNNLKLAKSLYARDIQEQQNLKLQAKMRKQAARARVLADDANRSESTQNYLRGLAQSENENGYQSLDVNYFTGNGLTADGGSLDSQNSDIVPVDAEEMKQAILKSELFKQLCAEAQYGEQQVAFDSQQSTANQIPTQQITEVSQIAKPVVAKVSVPAHPMMAFFTKVTA